MYQARLTKLYNAMQKAGLDGLVVNPGCSFSYLTGLPMHIMERPTVIFFALGKEPAIVLPKLEAIKLNSLAYNAQGITYDENPQEWQAAFDQAAKATGLAGKRVGTEPRALRLLEYSYLQNAAPGANWVDATAVFADLRNRKDASEVALMRKATQIAQDALLATLPSVRLGVTEKELANELVIQLLRHGCGPELPFAPIVASGPNSANPHAAPSDRPVQDGDMLLFDWGASYEGYVSDLTRTYGIGKVAEKYQNIHRVVEQANAAGRAAGGPGKPCADVDKAARGVIDAAGYGQYFRHRTGHGLGMEAHEDPYMRGDNMQLLEPGMAYTVEPGVYLAGENGVRIEDDMVVTETGAESLSDLPRGLQFLI